MKYSIEQVPGNGPVVHSPSSTDSGSPGVGVHEALKHWFGLVGRPGTPHRLPPQSDVPPQESPWKTPTRHRLPPQVTLASQSASVMQGTFNEVAHVLQKHREFVNPALHGYSGR